MNYQSKFPSIQESIFATMTMLSHKEKALNLGQGFPNFEAHPFLFERMSYYINNGFNQYATMMGMRKLRENISLMHHQLYGKEIDAQDEVTITSGATEALYCAFTSIVKNGDEVIIFDPAFDSYEPAILFNQGIPVHVNLNDDYSIDFERLKKKMTKKTKAIVLNSPHNPGGYCLTQKDLDTLWELIKDQEIYLISDEVYQHIIFDDKKHISPINDERLFERSFAISSFGKTFHVTGWKVGYIIAPSFLTDEVRKIHQFTTFCTSAASQMAISDMMEHFPNYYRELASFYQSKRDILVEGLEETDFILTKASGSYFQLLDYSQLSELDDVSFCKKLIQEYKLTTIPVSPFYHDKTDHKKIRVCFAKTDDVLKKAVEIFQSISS
jgi:methionine aminotransferase